MTSYTTVDITVIDVFGAPTTTQVSDRLEMAQEKAEAYIADRVAKGRDKRDRWNHAVIMAFTFCTLTRERRTFKMTAMKGYTDIKHVETVVVL